MSREVGERGLQNGGCGRRRRRGRDGDSHRCEGRPASGGFWLRMLFGARWLAAAVLVAERGERDVATVVTVVFLISFPIASRARARGSALRSDLAGSWLHLGRRLFVPVSPRAVRAPLDGAELRGSAAYLIGRAVFPELADWPGDLVMFPLIVLLPLGVQVARFRSGSNAIDRRRVQIVGLISATALVGQLILFGLQSGGWLGPPVAAESLVEPFSYALALLMPAGVALAMVPLGHRGRRLVDRLTSSGDDTLP